MSGGPPTPSCGHVSRSLAHVPPARTRKNPSFGPPPAIRVGHPEKGDGQLRTVAMHDIVRMSITRDKLYEVVWAEPVTTVAAGHDFSSTISPAWWKSSKAMDDRSPARSTGPCTCWAKLVGQMAQAYGK